MKGEKTFFLPIYLKKCLSVIGKGKIEDTKQILRRQRNTARNWAIRERNRRDPEMLRVVLKEKGRQPREVAG